MIYKGSNKKNLRDDPGIVKIANRPHKEEECESEPTAVSCWRFYYIILHVECAL